MSEVFVLINNDGLDEATARDNIFFRPLPTDMHNFDTSDALDSDSQMFTTTASRIKCKFGRFGETTGVYVNSTAVKCANPSMSITPD